MPKATGLISRGLSFLRHLPKKTLKFIKRRWKLSLVLLIIIAGGAFWQYKRTQANQVELTFENPVREKLIKTLEISGTVDAKEKARLRFLAGGKLTYLGAQEGDAVKKWQTIASIDQASLKKQLGQDLNNFMKERLDWDQTNADVYEDVYTTDEERIVEKGQLDLTNEVLSVEIRDIAISNTNLFAPFEGVLTKTPTTTSGVQLLSTDYFELINPNTLLFRAEIDESDIAQVKVGQEAEIVLDAYPEETVNSSVNYISYTSAETASGTVFYVEFPLDTTQRGLNFFRLGMNGDIDIVVDTRENVITIPLIALKERDGKSFVDVKVGENKTEEKEIEIGMETDEKVEVISGLSEDDLVLIPE